MLLMFLCMFFHGNVERWVAGQRLCWVAAVVAVPKVPKEDLVFCENAIYD